MTRANIGKPGYRALTPAGKTAALMWLFGLLTAIMITGNRLDRVSAAQAGEERPHAAATKPDDWQKTLSSGLLRVQRQWNDKDYQGAMRTLHDLYAQAPDVSAKVRLENTFLTEITKFPRSSIESLAGGIKSQNPGDARYKYPYCLVLWDQAERKYLSAPNAQAKNEALASLKELIRHGQWAEPEKKNQTLALLTRGEQKASPSPAEKNATASGTPAAQATEKTGTKTQQPAEKSPSASARTAEKEQSSPTQGPEKALAATAGTTAVSAAKPAETASASTVGSKPPVSNPIAAPAPDMPEAGNGTQKSGPAPISSQTRNGQASTNSSQTPMPAPNTLTAGSLPGTGKTIALLLPLGGKYADVGNRIVAGAQAALAELKEKGREVQVLVINTDDQGFENSLSHIAFDTIVGGPLTTEAFKKIAETDFIRTRYVFAFLSDLGTAVEGENAWRFFGSPKDQVKAIASYAVRELGLKKFGVLYPNDKYGTFTSKTFIQECESMGAEITASQEYPPDSAGKSVSAVKFMNMAVKPGQKSAQGLTPDFEAVFMPNSFATAQAMVRKFTASGADKFFLLGTDLWNQGLSKQKSIDPRMIQAALMPGSWKPSASNPAVASLRKRIQGDTDLWTSLGYDFIRFADRIDIPPVARNASEMNAILSASSNFDFSLVPIKWDRNGRAEQAPVIFQVEKNGAVPADKTVLRKILDTWRQQINPTEEQAQTNATAPAAKSKGAR